MTRSLSLIAALALMPLVACDPAPTEDAPGVTELEQALPRADVMRIDMPSGAFQVPQQATFYGFTWGVTSSINGFVRTITNVIEDVVELPPSLTDNETFAVWGPWTEPLSPATWQVRVDRVAPGQFEYVVQGWPRGEGAEAAVTVLSGTHTAGEADGQSTGAWRYDLTAARGLDPIAHDALGVVEVAYDVGAAKVLEVTFTEVQGRQDPQSTSTLYRYTEAADRAGTFDYISNLDIHADDDAALDRRELLRVRARWLPEGPGRADVLATHGDLPLGTQADVVECWGEAFTSTYLSVAWASGQQESGDAAACAYGDRQLPAFEAFDPNAFADQDLVEALPSPGEFEVEPAPVQDEVASPAVYYQIAKNTIAQLREHTGWVLRTVGDLSRNPPSTCAEGACQWGPWTDWESRISYVLVAAREEDDAVGYRLSMKRFGDASDWAAVLEGGYLPATEGEGQGWFVVDYDVVADLDPENGLRGDFRAEYARMGDQGALAARFDQVSWQGEAPYDARYFLAWNPDGGLLDAAFPANVDDDPAERLLKEDLVARVRWAPSGAGVGDVVVSGGDIEPGIEGLGVECWDEHAAQTHFAMAPRQVGGAALPDTDGPGCVVTDWQEPEFPPMGDERD